MNKPQRHEIVGACLNVALVPRLSQVRFTSDLFGKIGGSLIAEPES